MELRRNEAKPTKEAKRALAFSFDKFGDTTSGHKEATANSNLKGNKQVVRRATFFVPTIKYKFDEAYWNELLELARAYLPDAKSKRRRASSSGSGSGSGSANADDTLYDPDNNSVMEF